MDLSKLYEKQISFTEWFEAIHHIQSEQIRQEDNEKRERLKVLHTLIGLPFDEPQQFEAQEIVSKSPRFLAYLQEHGQDLCALRLIPKDPSLPKLRMRGQTVQEVVEKWLPQQHIDPTKYRADVVPHAEQNLWSTIFIVNTTGIFGEIISGGHHQLTQGFYQSQEPISFYYDFSTWHCADSQALAHLQTIISHLLVSQATTQQQLQQQCQANFSHNYLQGYFETVTTKEHGVWFIDYNRILGKMFTNGSLFIPRSKQVTQNIASSSIWGKSVYPGKCKGKVYLIQTNTPKGNELEGSTNFQPNSILVCEMTTPDFLPLMQKAAAIVTNQGGLLCHAAIVARELQKPCIVGTKIATSFFKDGEMVEVDAGKGIISKL